MIKKIKEKTPEAIYVVSGGKGLAGNNMVHSLLIQYPNNNVPVIIVPQVTDEKQLIDLVDRVKQEGGLSPEKLQKAEIILTGVSRSGKTPLSVYLAMYGWKVANIPLVFGIDPPKELFEVDPQRVFGLSISPAQLISHRMKRLRSIENTENVNYVDERLIIQEIRNANMVFEKGRFTVINVSSKPIETSANEILNTLANRFEYRGHRLESPYPEVKE